MRIVIQFTDQARLQLAGWQRSLSANPLDRQLLAETYTQVFCQRLVDAGGHLADALVVYASDPPTFWSRLAGATWLGYTVLETRRAFRRERLIRVVELRPGPPSEALPAVRRG